MKTTLISLLLILFLVGCNPDTVKDTGFRAQACLAEYCEKSENAISKKVLLKVIEMGLASQGISLDAKRGICERYYKSRSPANSLIYAKKSAHDVCVGEDSLDIQPPEDPG